MPQQYPGMAVNIGIRVGHLPMFLENVWHDLVNGVHHLEEFVVGHVLEGEFALARVAWVRFAQNRVSVPRDDLFGIERVPSKLRDGIGIDWLAFGLKFVLEFLNPFQDFLIGQPVQRTSQRVEAGTVRQEWIGQCGSDQVCGVCRRIPAFVIGVDAQIQAHEFVETRIVVSEHATEIGTVIERCVFGKVGVLVKVHVAVNGSRNFGQFGDATQNVLKAILVIIRFGDTPRIRLVKGTLGLTSRHTNAKLRHGVHRFGQTF